MHEMRKSCLLKMENDALLVANTGQPFSRLGVIAICTSHLGTKSDTPPQDIYDKHSDEQLVAAIQKEQLRIYETLNEITRDSNEEKETQLDYGGRAIWEL